MATKAFLGNIVAPTGFVQGKTGVPTENLQIHYAHGY